ncbi:hypothetical protein BB559_006079 [Furculomyces boomerangus]|uniref:Uncharacterized protein n=1 Tax=Furculomyces boomerangus TaxID=61424 RepID=A0A2T9XZK8_9FUNG|nr:hypothetical protein BB559_006977 [Furculomyces boomerangus]PVU87360.1 hypothetical protein BB559_006079 [Furculomyces boomerangus]
MALSPSRACLLSTIKPALENADSLGTEVEVIPKKSRDIIDILGYIAEFADIQLHTSRLLFSSGNNGCTNRLSTSLKNGSLFWVSKSVLVISVISKDKKLRDIVLLVDGLGVLLLVI